MRVIAVIFIIVVAIGVVLAFTGVLRFANNPDGASVTIDKRVLEEKTGSAVEKSKEVGGAAMEKAADVFEKTSDKKGASDREAVPSSDREPGTLPSHGGQHAPDKGATEPR